MGRALKRGVARHVAAFGLVVGVGVAVVSGCSLLVTGDTAQCATTADCLKFGPSRCIAGGCIPRATAVDASGDAPEPPCTSNQDCIARSGRTTICRKDDSQCVPLLSRDCGLVLGDTANDRSTVVGAILPTLGTQQAAGLAMTNALRLAVSELSSQATASRRPMVVVVCDETQDVARAAKHLTADLRVPAILGAMTSAATREAASTVTNAAGVALVSPTASAGLDTLAADGLVAALAAGDARQGAALALVAAEIVEPRARARTTAAAVRLAIARRGDVHGAELRAGLRASLTLNGLPIDDDANAANVVDVDYGDADSAEASDPSSPFTSALVAITQARPDIVVVLGHAEGATRLIRGVESNWPAGLDGARPLYLVSSGLMTADLFDVVGAVDAKNLARRIVGTAPGSDPLRAPAYARLLLRYAQTFPDAPTGRTYGVAHAYDALYALTYGLAAAALPTAPSSKELGRRAAAALARLDVPGATPIDVGPDGVAAALAALEADGGGGRIDLAGATGDLDLHTDGFPPTSDIQVWCLLHAAGAETSAFELAGRYLPARGTALAGTFSSACALLP